MRVSRRDNTLNDAIETLDQRLIESQKVKGPDIEILPRAWSMIAADELKFIESEIDKCIIDRRYFLENYYIIRDEKGCLKSLYPWFSHQEIIYEVVEDEWSTKGCCKLIILKPRQAGSTTWNAALIFHATIFVPNSFSIAMAHEIGASNEIYQRITDAFHALPWWLSASTLSKQQGKQIIFQRPDDSQRLTDPGLGSTLMISNAEKAAGVAIGRTIRNGLFSEVSRWNDTDIWTADIEPSLNAPDMLAIMESTAFGREGLYFNMWEAAEAGESDWRALFIPVYKVRKYFLPVLKSEQFTLTEEEKGIRDNVKTTENFTIPLGFFKWRRIKIKSTIAATLSDEKHMESYPLNAKQAFISSGNCAFDRKELNRQESVNCRPPALIGEIEYVGADQTPKLHLHTPTEDELKKKPTWHNRLWIWEQPESSSETIYYEAGDVGGGEKGNDFSDIVVYRLGYANEPDYQVAEWHGHMNPSHLARVVAAMGQWYNGCEIAVEYAASGITTCNELQWALDYSSIYRWKHLDKIGGTQTQHMHWMTTQRTREDSLNRMNERLLDHTIVIRNKFLIEEMRDFGRFDNESKVQGLSANDDMVMASLIAMGASSQSGLREAMTDAMSQGTGVSSSAAASVMANVPHRYMIMDHYNRNAGEFNTQKDAEQFILDYGKANKVDLRGVWRIVPVVVQRANTPWSPAFDGQGSARELMEDHGVTPRDQMMSPNIIEVYKQILNAKYRAGQDMRTIDSDDDF